MVQIESLRPRYCPFSHRLTFRFRDVRQYVEIVQLVQHLSNNFTDGQGIQVFRKQLGPGQPCDHDATKLAERPDSSTNATNDAQC